MWLYRSDTQSSCMTWCEPCKSYNVVSLGLRETPGFFWTSSLKLMCCRVIYQFDYKCVTTFKQAQRKVLNTNANPVGTKLRMYGVLKNVFVSWVYVIYIKFQFSFLCSIIWTFWYIALYNVLQTWLTHIFVVLEDTFV